MNEYEASWSNEALRPSEATSEDIDDYCYGECHVFAVALSRLTGWPMHVVTDREEVYWASDDGEETIPSVVHVLCEDREGNFWDVRGCRPRVTLFEEMSGWHAIMGYGSDDRCDETDIRHYSGCWGEAGEEAIDRPLSDFGETDIELAIEVVRRVLPGVSSLHTFSDPAPICR